MWIEDIVTQQRLIHHSIQTEIPQTYNLKRDDFSLHLVNIFFLYSSFQIVFLFVCMYENCGFEWYTIVHDDEHIQLLTYTHIHTNKHMFSLLLLLFVLINFVSLQLSFFLYEILWNTNTKFESIGCKTLTR